MRCNKTYKMAESETMFESLKRGNRNAPSAVHLPSICGSSLLHADPQDVLLHHPSMCPPYKSKWRAHGGQTETWKSALSPIRIGQKCGTSPIPLRIENRNFSLGSEFRGIWVILGRFWPVKVLEWGSVKVGGGAEGDWSREEVGGGGYGEEIAGCGEERIRGDRRLAVSGDRGGDRRVVGEERAGIGGCGRRLEESCRDSGKGAVPEDQQKPGKGVVTADEEKLRRRVGSKVGGCVVTVAEGSTSVARGQP